MQSSESLVFKVEDCMKVFNYSCQYPLPCTIYLTDQLSTHHWVHSGIPQKTGEEIPFPLLLRKSEQPQQPQLEIANS